MNNREGDSTCFGVIIGLYGTSKSIAMTDLCLIYPEEVYYYEITEPTFFVSGLAEKLGMKIKPTSVFYLLLEYVSSKYCHYYRFPDCLLVGIAMVLNTLQAAAVKYKLKHGREPVLFLDGSDQLAKHDAPLFNRLLVHAKVLLLLTNYL